MMQAENPGQSNTAGLLTTLDDDEKHGGGKTIS